MTATITNLTTDAVIDWYLFEQSASGGMPSLEASEVSGERMNNQEGRQQGDIGPSVPSEARIPDGPEMTGLGGAAAIQGPAGLPAKWSRRQLIDGIDGRPQVGVPGVTCPPGRLSQRSL
ncbi:hypothetical protein AB0H37_43940 [Actinomadura sp. NPDC023710]